MGVALLVLGILVVTAAGVAAVLIPLVGRWRRAADEFWAAFDDVVARSGAVVVIPRSAGVYRGSTGSFPQVKGNGSMVLTTDRLLFRKATGGQVEVPVADIVGVDTAKSFAGARVGGQTHLVVHTATGGDVGFFVDDLDRWTEAVRRVASAGG